MDRLGNGRLGTPVLARSTFAHPMFDPCEEPWRKAWQQHQHDHGHGAEPRQPKFKMGKHNAERQHGTEIGNEAGREDDLAQLGLV